MARQIVVELVGDSSKFNRSMDQASGKAGGFMRLAKGGFGIGAGIAAFNVASSAISGVTGFLGDAIGAASDLNEVTSKSGQIFGQQYLPELEKWASGADKAFGQSKRQALEAASTFGIFGKSAGLAGTELTGFSTEMTELAGDLASFHNSSPEEAITAIGAALRGESEPIRRFGVLLDDATLRARAMKMGLIDTTNKALTPQQKVLAAHAEIMEQTADAQGDFGRTADGAANKQRILTAQMENQQAKIGQKLQPVWIKLMDLFEKVGLPILEKLGDAIGILATILEKVVGVFDWASDQIGGFLNNIAMNFGDMGTRVEKIAEATGKSVKEVQGEIDDAMQETGASFEEAADTVEREFGVIPKEIHDAWDKSVDTTRSEMRQMRQAAADGARDTANAAIRPIVDLRAKYRDAAFQSAVEYARGLRDGRDAVKVQLALLREDLAASMSRTEEIAYLKGLLTGKAIKRGLASADPIVIAQTKATVEAINLRLETLGVKGYKAGYSGGVSTVQGLADALREQGWKAAQAMQQAMQLIRNQMPGSEPKDPRSPLRGITTGFGMMDVLAKGIESDRRSVPNAIRSAIGGPVQANAMFGLSTASGASGSPIVINIASFVGSDREIDKFADRLALRLKLAGA